LDFGEDNMQLKWLCSANASSFRFGKSNLHGKRRKPWTSEKITCNLNGCVPPMHPLSDLANPIFMEKDETHSLLPFKLHAEIY